MKRSEIAELSGLNLKEVKALIRDENPVNIEWDRLKGYRLFDPFNLIKSDCHFRGSDGWTDWTFDD